MELLIDAALKAREKAYAPYSCFKVGAAVLGKSGTIYTGVNVENASYGLTICAERAAIAKAVSEGETELVAIAVVADSAKPAVPCGACRQVMAEFGIEHVIMGNIRGERLSARAGELLPHAFSNKDFVGDNNC